MIVNARVTSLIAYLQLSPGNMLRAGGSIRFPKGAETALEAQLLPGHAETTDAGARSIVLDVREPNVDDINHIGSTTSTTAR